MHHKSQLALSPLLRIHVRLASLILCVFVSMMSMNAYGQELLTEAQKSGPTGFYNSEKRVQTLKIDGATQLRFVTTLDFPPFGFTDNAGKLSGFHLELARLSCDAANIPDACSIQSAPFEEIESLLELGQVDAALAGHQITAGMRSKFAFSSPYFRWPHRFLAKQDADFDEPLANALLDRNVGVMSGTIHEAALQSFFKATLLTPFTEETALYDALKTGAVDAIYGDGVTLGFYQLSAEAEACCKFVGGAYYGDALRSDVMAIMINRDKVDVQATMQAALRIIQRNGGLDELLLRWFPFDLYGEEAQETDMAG